MSLSSGTLNLKFMQRGAALKAASASASTSTSNPSSSSSTTITKTTTTITNTTIPPTSTVASTSTTNPLKVVEEEAKWTLPSRQAASTSTSKPASKQETRISFEPSYLPFLISSTDTDTESNRGSSRSGGGRISFGGFGWKEEIKEREGDVEMNEDEEEEEQVIRKGKGKGREVEHVKREIIQTSNPPPIKLEKGKFHRPAGFTPSPSPPPSTSNGIPIVKHQSTPRAEKATPANKLRQTIASSTTNSYQKKRGVEDEVKENGKRIKVEIGDQDLLKGSEAKVETGGEIGLDERQRLAKAARKAERRKRAKERRLSGVEGAA